MSKLDTFLDRLSPRERNLVYAVAVLVPLFTVMLLARGAITNVRELDARIDGLQRQIVDYHFQIAQKQLVEAEYEKVAAQHSSEWDQQTISDRMRAEIRRLARRFPPPLDASGAPVSTENEYGDLVELPGLDEGTLTPGEGYREHTLRLGLPLDELTDVIAFLERIQDSPQSLRIDDLELYRPPMTTLVNTSMTITRTVVNRDVSQDIEGNVPQPVTETGSWIAEGCTLVGQDNVRAVAERDGGQVYRLVDLPAGEIYEMQLDVSTRSSCSMAVGDAQGAKTLEGTIPFASDGTTKRYRAQFRVPGKRGASTQLRLPLVAIAEQDGSVRLENFALLRIAG